MPRIILVLALVAAVAVPAASPAVAAKPTPPPTLDGQTFGAEPTFLNVNCTQTGTSEFSYHATGLATGPYAGTFVEDGTVTIGEQSIPHSYSAGGGAFELDWVEGAATTIEASFTINSTQGSVTGTRSLTVPGLSACQDAVMVSVLGQSTAATAELRRANGDMTYTAKITVGRKSYCDHGTSVLTMSTFSVGSPVNQGIEAPGFSSWFTSDLDAPAPARRGAC